MTKGAGRYRTHGTVERVKTTATRDAAGKVDLTNDANWQPYCDVRVEERQITGRETLTAQQVMADVTGLYRLRADPTTTGIVPKMRLRIDGRKLNIVRAIKVGNPVREIELQCLEVV